MIALFNVTGREKYLHCVALCVTLISEMELHKGQLKTGHIMKRDPITNEVMETKGKIRFKNGKCVDETGKEVTLNKNVTWVYKK